MGQQFNQRRVCKNLHLDLKELKSQRFSLRLSHWFKNSGRRSVASKMSAAHQSLWLTASATLQLLLWRTIKSETSFSSQPCRKQISGRERLWQQEKFKRVYDNPEVWRGQWELSACGGLGSTLLVLASSRLCQAQLWSGPLTTPLQVQALLRWCGRILPALQFPELQPTACKAVHRRCLGSSGPLKDSNIMSWPPPAKRAVVLPVDWEDSRGRRKSAITRSLDTSTATA